MSEEAWSRVKSSLRQTNLVRMARMALSYEGRKGERGGSGREEGKRAV